MGCFSMWASVTQTCPHIWDDALETEDDQFDEDAELENQNT